jgi:hypothetical protein
VVLSWLDLPASNSRLSLVAYLTVRMELLGTASRVWHLLRVRIFISFMTSRISPERPVLATSTYAADKCGISPIGCRL